MVATKLLQFGVLTAILLVAGTREPASPGKRPPFSSTPTNAPSATGSIKMRPRSTKAQAPKSLPCAAGNRRCGQRPKRERSRSSSITVSITSPPTAGENSARSS